MEYYNHYRFNQLQYQEAVLQFVLRGTCGNVPPCRFLQKARYYMEHSSSSVGLTYGVNKGCTLQQPDAKLTPDTEYFVNIRAALRCVDGGDVTESE
jgi:hypothetical protein